MKIIINTETIRSPLTGIGRYTLELARALREIGQDVKGLTNDPFIPPKTADKNIWQYILQSLPYVRNIKQWHLQTKIDKIKPTPKIIYHEPNFIPLHFKGTTVITIHDLSFLRYPETHPKQRVLFLKKHLEQALKKSHHILTPSNFTRKEIIEIYDTPPEKITTTPLGISHNIFFQRSNQACKQTLQRYGLTWKGFILSVSTFEPRKNIILCLSAFKDLPEGFKKNHPLVLAGSRGWLYKTPSSLLANLQANNYIKILGYVSDEDLACLYSAAKLFIYPSIYEGFGLPALEAMACGTPVITSTAEALVDATGDAAVHIHPKDKLCLKNEILRLCLDDKSAYKLSALGLDRARQFTWTTCAVQTLHGYKQAIKDV